jgi:hypothetical protein
MIKIFTRKNFGVSSREKSSTPNLECERSTSQNQDKNVNGTNAYGSEDSSVLRLADKLGYLIN